MILNLIRDINEYTADKINEQILTEKCWVKITPKNSNDSFYFYAKDRKNSNQNEIKKDIDNLINHLTGKKSGTYKQSLYRPAKEKFSTALKQANNLYSIDILGSLDKEIDPEFILSQTDRDLRKIAKSTVLDDENYTLLRPSGTNKILIHHIDGKEYNNDIENLAVVEYTSDYAKDGSLDLAHAVHKILHAMCKDNNDLKAKLRSEKYLTYVTFKFIDEEDSSKTKEFKIFIGVVEEPDKK